MSPEQLLQRVFEQFNADEGAEFFPHPKAHRGDEQPVPPAQFYRLDDPQRRAVERDLLNGSQSLLFFVNGGRAFVVEKISRGGVTGYRIRSAEIEPVAPPDGPVWNDAPPSPRHSRLLRWSLFAAAAALGLLGIIALAGGNRTESGDAHAAATPPAAVGHPPPQGTPVTHEDVVAVLDSRRKQDAEEWQRLVEEVKALTNRLSEQSEDDRKVVAQLAKQQAGLTADLKSAVSRTEDSDAVYKAIKDQLNRVENGVKEQKGQLNGLETQITKVEAKIPKSDAVKAAAQEAVNNGLKRLSVENTFDRGKFTGFQIVLKPE